MDANKEKGEIERIVNTLCDDYKSHSFQINREEAKKIGLKVKDASTAEHSAMMDILKFYLSRNTGIPASPTTGQTFQMYIAWLDSLTLQMRCEANAKLEQDGKIKVLNDRWMLY